MFSGQGMSFVIAVLEIAHGVSPVVLLRRFQMEFLRETEPASGGFTHRR